MLSISKLSLLASHEESTTGGQKLAGNTRVTNFFSKVIKIYPNTQMMILDAKEPVRNILMAGTFLTQLVFWHSRSSGTVGLLAQSVLWHK